MTTSPFERTPDQEAVVAGWTPPEIDTTKAHTARMYDFYLDGKTNFAADRAAAEQIMAAFPTMRTTAQQNRAFAMRAVRHLAGLGLRQFLDIGTGIPIEGNNTHDAAQAVAPDSRVVYVDNDPIVLAHARALLAGRPEGATAYIDADARRPEAILADPRLIETLDLTRPVGVLVVAVLHFVSDDEKPADILRRLTDPLPAGSHLVVSHATGDFTPATASTSEATYRDAGITLRVRSRDEVAALVPDGWELLEPGIDSVSHWRPAPGAEIPDPADVGCWGFVARKN